MPIEAAFTAAQYKNPRNIVPLQPPVSLLSAAILSVPLWFLLGPMTAIKITAEAITQTMPMIRNALDGVPDFLCAEAPLIAANTKPSNKQMIKTGMLTSKNLFPAAAGVLLQALLLTYFIFLSVTPFGKSKHSSGLLLFKILFLRMRKRIRPTIKPPTTPIRGALNILKISIKRSGLSRPLTIP
jgi:hypothetical protein